MDPSFRPSHILLFGATGNIGQHIAKNIISSRPAFSKITVFTSPNSATTKADLINGWKAAGVSIIVGDVTSAADVQAAYDTGADTIVSALGRDALAHQIQLLRLAERTEGVKWFFPSEFGTDTEHNEQSPHEKPHQHKLAVHRLVRDEIRRVKVTNVVVGPFFENWAGMPAVFREKLGGIDVVNRKAVVLGQGEQRISFTTKDDVGKAVVAALRHPEAKSYLRVASFVVTANQVLAEYEKQLDAKFSARYIPLADVEANEKSMWEEKHPIAVVATLGRIWANGGAEYPDGVDNDAIGLDAVVEPLSVAVREHIKLASA